MSRDTVEYPEFASIRPGEQLFDVWNEYYDDRLGPVFPHSVVLPIGGLPTEEGEAIFGNHFRVMEQREREWQIAGRLFSVVRSRLDANVPIAEDGETVLALPRTDFDEVQNRIAQDGVVKRGLAVFTDRSGYDFPENFDASWSLPRYARRLGDGSVELLQEQDASLAVREAGLATGGIVVAVKRLYGPNHRRYESDIRAVGLTLSPHSLVTSEYQAHPAVYDTLGKNRTLDLGDDAIVERLNGQRPRTIAGGTTLE